LKIVFVSEDGLPDMRVEKMMNTLAPIADEIHFVGRFKRFSGFKLLKKPIVHSVEWDRKVNLFIEPYYTWVKNKVLRIIDDIKPDLVIAVNLVAGSMLYKTSYNVVMDYHEVWSLLLKYIEPQKFLSKITYFIRKHKYPALEEKLVSKYPTITFSKYTCKYFREKYGLTNSIVVKNFPSKHEFENIEFRELECGEKIFTYIGKMTLEYDGQSYKDIRPTIMVLDKLWSENKRFSVHVAGVKYSDKPYIKPLGWLQHIELYSVIRETHAGIHSYKPSPIQYLVDPNKVYIYMHSGATPVVTDTHRDLLETIGRKAFIVESSNYMDSLYRTYREIIEMDCMELNKFRKQAFEYARNNLVWEKQDTDIIDFIKRNM